MTLEPAEKRRCKHPTAGRIKELRDSIRLSKLFGLPVGVSLNILTNPLPEQIDEKYPEEK